MQVLQDPASIALAVERFPDPDVRRLIAAHVATLKALVDAGANVDLADRSGTSPLALARSRGYREMVAILERAGAR